jgi:hypothetical protein
LQIGAFIDEISVGHSERTNVFTDEKRNQSILTSGIANGWVVGE